MGQMVNGIWESRPTNEVKVDGQFVRKPSAFRNWVTEDGAPGPTGHGGFTPEAGRYHLYVSYACPWAHRVLIYRSLLGLEHAIDISVVHPVNMENGWEFAEYPGATPDHLKDARFLYQVYAAADPAYSGKVTVPVLWDRQGDTIVNNESADIMRMLGGAFRPLATSWQEFCPDDRRDEIDALNDEIYRHINNGVYRTGFAVSQEAYETAARGLFGAMAALDARLADSRFLLGDTPLEPDWRLFTTMIRFEPVYYFHFKCNLRPLAAYPNLRRHTRALLNFPKVRGTVHLDHIVDHYYLAHRRINPHGIIPLGAHVDLDGPDWCDLTDEGTA
ncbi:glutathione S-transferase family protein [Palleronia sp. KMU-117]|uniref:glutathione S-transferase family protein n=1 Tax=Palleronia sp. KMU-117 TaxID=3434108 RepID=UPI003D720D06